MRYLKTIKTRQLSHVGYSALVVLMLVACSQSSEKRSESDRIDKVAVTPVMHKGADDGSQLNSPFRINYAGYLPLQDKIAVYLTKDAQPIEWILVNSASEIVASGTSNQRRENDYASGDSFFLIDFSQYQVEGAGYYLVVNDQASAPFDISNDPYGDLKYEFFDYFKDHRRTGDIFNRSVENWTEHSVTLDFIADAGDQGYYTANAAEAQWSLINLLESYPNINSYYQQHSDEMATVYDELVFFSRPMDKVIFPGEQLAVAKLATVSNQTWALCPGATGETGPCISKPETKATYSVARTLAAMARLHKSYGTQEQLQHHYQHAKLAFRNAETHPYVCLTWQGFGGEGGYYPNNDNFSLFREPRSHRDPCAEGINADPKDNNINDDHYAAAVELLIAADKLGYIDDAVEFKQKVESHSHHQKVGKFFFGAVGTEGTLSLLTHRPNGVDLSDAEENVLAYADKVLEYQQVGYPGITFDVQSTEWQADDRDELDSNFRWGSNRMQLNDARIVMMAAKLSYEKQLWDKVVTYTNAVLRVLDEISGTNAVALAMYTAADYPNIENAITRTHDLAIPDSEDGKMVLGPNNWTNSNDPDMPAFGSKPGMKMFALTGTGWASREISIDANAALVPVSYFATEVAPGYLAAAKAAVN